MTKFYLNNINDGLGVSSILYFINYNGSSCVLFIHERKFVIRTERGKWPWCCLYFDANSAPQGGDEDKE